MADSPILLSTALLDRGFLVEKVYDDIYLTDNACLYARIVGPDNRRLRSDQELLTSTLQQLDLGSLLPCEMPGRAARLSAPDQPLSPQQLELLFSPRHVRQEAGYARWEARLKVLKKRQHVAKVYLEALDTHIALLVKALSAASCATWSSCDGHDKGRAHPLHVSFVGPVNLAWAQYLFASALSAGLDFPDLQFNQDEELSETESSLQSPQRDLRRVREQAIRLGRFIYENRLKFRAERLDWLSRYENTLTPEQTRRN